MLELSNQQISNKRTGILSYPLDRTSVRNFFGRSNAELNTVKDCSYHAS